MSPTPAPSRLRAHLTLRAAALVAAPALLAFWLPGAWGWVVVWAWLLAAAVLLRVDHGRAAHPEDLEIEREVPAKFSVGVPNAVVLTVRNVSAKRARLRIRETPPPSFSGERHLGDVAVAPRGELRRTLRLTPSDRGLYRFGAPGVRSLGPWGLAGWQGPWPLETEARVYPDIKAVESYALLAKRGRLPELGVRPTRITGAGREFESLREWQPGDDYRDVDWKATARSGKPIVRLFEAERSQTMMIAVDAGRLMTARVGELTKLDRAVNAALLLTYLGVRADDYVGLMVFGRDVQAYLPPRKGHRQFLAVLDALYKAEGALEEPDYGRALRYVAARLTKRSLFVLFTDLLGAEPSGRLLEVLGTLPRRHLPLVVTQRNREVETMGIAEPAKESDVFVSSVAEDLLRDKAAAVGSLTARGVLVLDVDPAELSVASVNRYLELKARGRL